MFLSKVVLAAGGQSRSFLLNLQRNGAYAEHQVLWQLFREDEKRQFLFRQDNQAGNNIYYVLSSSAPLSHPAFVVQTKVFRPRLKEGQPLAFSLRANPTVCLDRKRHDVLMHAKQQAIKAGVERGSQWHLMEQAAQEWLTAGDRLAQWGIGLNALPMVESYVQHRCKKKNGQDIEFSSVDYQGILTVLDVERFWQQYCHGFGRSKALGCGLMLIRAA